MMIEDGLLGSSEKKKNLIFKKVINGFFFSTFVIYKRNVVKLVSEIICDDDKASCHFHILQKFKLPFFPTLLTDDAADDYKKLFVETELNTRFEYGMRVEQ
jgi:hypothetical protein